MKKNLYHQIGICLSLFLCSTFTGCIKDDLSHCLTDTYRLIVQTDAGDQVVSGSIKDVLLFIFDKNNRFVDARSVSLDKVVELEYPEYSVLKVVAWANTGSGLQNISPADENLVLENGFVSLLDSEEEPETGFSKSPDDLFHGIKTLDMTLDTRKQPQVLTIKRKVAAITILAKHLKEYAESITGSPGTDADYYYVVRSGKNTIDFSGNLAGNDTKYKPSGSFNSNGELVAPAFFVFPTEAGKYMEVDIYKGPTKIFTIDKDQNGQPIQAQEGKFITLSVDFGTDIKTEITIEEWDKIDISEEF